MPSTEKGCRSGDSSQPSDQPPNEALLKDLTLLQKREMHFTHLSEKDAFLNTLKHLKQTGGPLPNDLEPTLVKVNPGHPEVEGLRNGMGNKDRGWRIDFDDKKGMHFNWYDWSNGSRKSGLGRWAAETFPGKYEDYQDWLIRFHDDREKVLSGLQD